MNGSAEPPPFSDSDREWLAALEGADISDAPAAREGRMLRMALDQRRLELEADLPLDAAAGERQLQRLLADAAARGLVAPAPVEPVQATAPSNVIAFPNWRRRSGWLALAAAVVLGVALIGPRFGRPDYPEPPETSGSGVVLTIRGSAQKDGAERLVERLRQIGLKPGLYQRGQVYVVDVRLLPSDVEAARPVFAEFGLVPAEGSNRIEFQP